MHPGRMPLHRGQSDFYRNDGFTAEEVKGRTTTEIGLCVDPDERDMIIEAVSQNQVLRNKEIQVRSKSGEIITGSCRRSP